MRLFTLLAVLLCAAVTRGGDGRAAKSRILYAVNSGGNFDVHVMNADGSGKRQLTDSPGTDNMAKFSPDGRLVVFRSTRDGNDEIYVMNADGSNARRITDNAGSDVGPRFLPDGRTIAFASDRDGDYEIYTMSIDGTNVVRRTRSRGHDLVGDVSPDGRRLLFQSRRNGNWDILLLDLATNEVSPIVASEDAEFTARYSPDGRRIAFTLQGASPLHRTIVVMNLDGSGRNNVTGQSEFCETPCFSPDGRRIAFEWRRTVATQGGPGPGGQRDRPPGIQRSSVAVVDVDGSRRKPLVDTECDSFPSDWRECP